jgi:mannose-6-phosphate isomerase-like protein (cupin superfamily)
MPRRFANKPERRRRAVRVSGALTGTEIALRVRLNPALGGLDAPISGEARWRDDTSSAQAIPNSRSIGASMSASLAGAHRRSLFLKQTSNPLCTVVDRDSGDHARGRAQAVASCLRKSSEQPVGDCVLLRNRGGAEAFENCLADRRQAMKKAVLATSAAAILCTAVIAQLSGISGQSQSVQQSDQSRHQTPMQSEAGRTLKGFVADIENLTDDNSNFRRVLYTGKNLQLVLMALKPGEQIGEEVHADGDQFFRVEEGNGEVQINGQPTKIKGGDAVLVPAGARHNVINTGGQPLRLYTLYAPPQHRDGTVQATKSEAGKSQEHFDGKTTEAQ